VKRVFELLGDSETVASKRADTVMRIETALAKASLDRVSRRDPSNVYHKMNLQELVALTPSFDWPKYLRAVDAPPVNAVNVAVPDFFKQVQSMLGGTSLDDWKTYLTWQLVRAQSPLLPTSFVQENFDFYGKTLTGAKELRARWKRCVALVDGQLGEALGQLYVDRTFGAEGKQKTLKMVQAIESALARDITELAWMTPETKKYALEKLHAVANKIGYPDKWRDYSTVKVVRGDAIGNADRASEFEFHRQIAKIGKPVDRMEWLMTPPTVNAYYDPPMNDINFPAGILQPPFFDSKLDEATNLGAIGAVIGHELTHGFDDEGRKFDAKGNLRDWWTPRDASQFDARADCFVQQYSGYTAVDDIKLNGKLTLGENTADNGGVRLAYMALMDRLASGAGDGPGKINGYTPEQRLFLGYAKIWCMRRTPESSRMRAMVDPHSPGASRVNGVLSNMPEFQRAFGCKAGQPMAPAKECRVW
jgi:endothelin-converting enzyme/putative endopeptidase